MRVQSEIYRTLYPFALPLVMALVPASLSAQLPSPMPSPHLDLGPEPHTMTPISAPLLHSAERYVVIRLAENQLYLLEGDQIIWSAPAIGRASCMERALVCVT